MSEPSPGARAGDVESIRRVISLVEARRVRGAGSPPQRRRSVADLIGGSYEETEAGPILFTSRHYPLDYRHGRYTLGKTLTQSFDNLVLVARSQESRELRADRILYLDTETTGLMGGTGVYAFLVGVGFFENGGFTLRQYFMEDLDREPAMVAALSKLIPRFDAMVTFNGRAFDFPILETRFILSRLRWPRGFHDLDLLWPSRALWREHLSDYRLITIEREVLGYHREDDIDGGMVPITYFEYLRHRHPDEIVRVFPHNADDILSLVALAGWQASVFSDPSSVDLAPAEWFGLGRIWERFEWERCLHYYRQALDLGLKGELRYKLAKRLGYIEKRRGQWDEAKRHWEECIASGSPFDPDPWEELAKHYEHRAKQYERAKELVLTALDHARARGSTERLLIRLEHRLSRLTRHLAANTVGTRS